MNRMTCAIGLGVFFAAGGLANADETVRHPIMFAEYGKGPNRIVELDADGKVVWEHRPPSISVIFQVLPEGRVLYAYGGKPTGVQEVDRTHKVDRKSTRLNSS